MNEELMTWVAGISIAGFMYLLYRNWILTHTLRTLAQTADEELAKYKHAIESNKIVCEGLFGMCMESVEVLMERCDSIEETVYGKPEEETID